MLLLLMTVISSGNPVFANADEVRILTKGGEHVFRTTVADTDDRRARGLMFRRSMAADDSMLFDFRSEQPVFFWMKNTFVPLDMIFVKSDGAIAHIHHDAVPQSETIIPSGQPVRYVLEVVAGTARRLGLVTGDRIVHPVIKP
ncbi:DUF192 domain-containing protein [Coralliovum pocilloporae]|uniref:DUF192 domain-containing protein n=1 Tax=Coralliovum pocilloporae TaxID=3066369 RepID=UPI0033070B64